MFFFRFIPVRLKLALAIVVGCNTCTAATTASEFELEPQLRVAKEFVQRILEEDSKPHKGFYGRSSNLQGRKTSPMPDCASYAIARAVEAKTPYFEDARRNVIAVPVWAELLILDASQSGGPRAAMDGSLPSLCAFEYERWSFQKGRFEKIDGFRSRTHYEEFTSWGDSVIQNQTSRWVSIDPSKRYVRFLVRVEIGNNEPRQLPPQFPVHYSAAHSLNLLRIYLANKQESLVKRISLRDSRASGEELERDMTITEKQIKGDIWVIDHLTGSLELLKKIKPFEDMKR